MEDLEREGGSRQAIVADLVGILEELTSDWDTEFSGGISGATCLIGDLAFESVDVVQLMLAIQEHYGRHDIPFEDLLMVDGRYVTDLAVGQIADFLAKHVAR